MGFDFFQELVIGGDLPVDVTFIGGNAAKERQEAEDAARKEQERLNKIRRLKANALQDKVLLANTFIVTTDLTLSELENPKDTAHTRIYDRIGNAVPPICFSSKNYRKENAKVAARMQEIGI